LNISEITDIKTTSAYTGGMIIYNGGSDIIESGVAGDRYLSFNIRKPYFRFIGRGNFYFSDFRVEE
jgi:hypothetical protein